MDCYLCKMYRNAKWRNTPDKNEEGKRKEAKTRYCATKTKYVSGDDEACPDFIPDGHFFCDRHNITLTTAQCLIRKQKGLSRKCKKCRQVNEVIQLHKKLSLYERIAAREAGIPVPLLRRRKPVEQVEIPEVKLTLLRRRKPQGVPNGQEG
jgi:hypothetical protein